LSEIRVIIQGIFLVGLIYFISFLIEKITGLRLLIDSLIWKKSLNRAIGAAGFHSIFIFFLPNLLVSIIVNKPDDFTIWLWFIFIMPLTIIYGIIVYIFTPKDPSKADNDYT